MTEQLNLQGMPPAPETDADAFADELAEILYSHDAALRLRVHAHKLSEHPQEAAACFHRLAMRLQQLYKKQASYGARFCDNPPDASKISGKPRRTRASDARRGFPAVARSTVGW